MPKTDSPPLRLPALPGISRRQMLHQAGLTALALALPRAGRAGGRDGADPAVRWGRDAIRQAMARPGAPAALSVALLQEGEIVWREAFGWAVPGRLKAGPDTRFNIGSVSKVLAALATVILQDRGQVRLDDPAVRYLPGFTMLSPEYRQITLRHLLSHSSGLPGTNGSRCGTCSATARACRAPTAAISSPSRPYPATRPTPRPSWPTRI